VGVIERVLDDAKELVMHCSLETVEVRLPVKVVAKRDGIRMSNKQIFL
jgi:hypothetical protein